MDVIIVDDERSGRETLAMMLKELAPDMKLVAMASSAEEAIKAIGSLDPDLVFLDIQMPKVNGFQMLEQLTEIDFEIIFVTAYNHYAMQAFKYSAFDYLLKPLDPEELTLTLQRVREKIVEAKDNAKQFQTLKANLKAPASGPVRIAVPDATGYAFLEVAHILRIEGLSNTTVFYMVDGATMQVNRMIKDYEEMLSESFCRVHKKHLINLKHARKYIKGDGGEILMSDGSCVDVSRRKKQEVINRLKLLH